MIAIRLEINLLPIPRISLIKLDFHRWTKKSRTLNIVCRTVVNQ